MALVTAAPTNAVTHDPFVAVDSRLIRTFPSENVLARGLLCQRRMTLRAAFILFSTLLSLPASAFELQTDSEGDLVQWRRGMELLVDENFAAQLGTAAVRESMNDLLTHLRDAAPGMKFEATVGPSPTWAIGYEAGKQNVNAIIGLADWPYTSSNLAVTLTTLNVRTNEILDTDILFNTSKHVINVLPSVGVHYDRGFDLQNALTHEIGHALGLRHNDADDALVMFSSTFAGELTKRVLKDDDRAGLRALYGSAPAFAEASAITESNDVPVAGCSAAGQAPLLLIALLGLLRSRRRRAGAAAAAALAVATPALAAEPGEAVFSADAVSLARVVDRVSASHPTAPGVIYTRLTLQTAECLKGQCQNMSAAVVWGGRVGDLEQIVAHEPVPPLGAAVLVTRRGAVVGVVAPPDAELVKLAARLRSTASAARHTPAPVVAVSP